MIETTLERALKTWAWRAAYLIEDPSAFDPPPEYVHITSAIPDTTSFYIHPGEVQNVTVRIKPANVWYLVYFDTYRYDWMTKDRNIITFAPPANCPLRTYRTRLCVEGTNYQKIYFLIECIVVAEE